MKLPVFSLLVGLAAIPVFGADPDLNDTKDRTSYALGVNFGQNLKKEGLEVNLDTVRKGIEDAFAGNPKLNPTEMGETFKQLQMQMAAKREEKAKENKVLGEKFLAENATKPNIKTNVSGLQYRIVQEGSGDSPKAIDKVSVKYTGKFIDGTVFDSTDKRGGIPAQFGVNGVIKGWSEALQMMKKGAKWELYIPSEIAYGARGDQRGGIPGNSTLIFDVELVDIHPVTPPPTLPPPQQPVTSDIIKVPSADELKAGAKIEIIKPEDVEKEIAKEKARKEAEEKAKQKP